MTLTAPQSELLPLDEDRADANDLVDYFHLDSERVSRDTIRHFRDRKCIGTWTRQPGRVGNGAFGVVWLEKEEDGRVRVVKEIDKEKATSNTKAGYISELMALAKLAKYRTNFPEYYGWFQDQKFVFIAMEYFPAGNLRQSVTQSLVTGDVVAIVGQIAAALQIMHHHRITHRDLKPENILVRQRAPNWQVVVADFGSSKRVRNGSTGLVTMIVGDFVAPEERSGGEIDEYTSAVDIWSLGCICYWLFTQAVPVSVTNMRKYLDACRRSDSEAQALVDMTGIEPPSAEFIFQTLKLHPEDRPSAQDICNHDWVLSNGKPAKGPHSEEYLVSGIAIQRMDASGTHTPDRALVNSQVTSLHTDTKSRADRVSLGQSISTGGNLEPTASIPVATLPIRAESAGSPHQNRAGKSQSRMPIPNDGAGPQPGPSNFQGSVAQVLNPGNRLNNEKWPIETPRTRYPRHGPKSAVEIRWVEDMGITIDEPVRIHEIPDLAYQSSVVQALRYGLAPGLTAQSFAESEETIDQYSRSLEKATEASNDRRFKDEAEIYSKLLVEHENDPYLLYLRSDAYSHAGIHGPAINDGKTLTLLYPSTPDSWLCLGNSRRSAGKVAEAMNAYTEGARHRGTNQSTCQGKSKEAAKLLFRISQDESQQSSHIHSQLPSREEIRRGQHQRQHSGFFDFFKKYL